MRETKYFVNSLCLPQVSNSIEDESSMKLTTQPQYQVFRTGSQQSQAKVENTANREYSNLETDKFELPQLMSMSTVMNY